MQITAATLAAAMGDLVATGGAFDPVGCFIGLATQITNVGLNTDISDVTEATGGLATRQEITAWTGPFELADGSVYYDGPRMIFHPTSGDAGQVVTQWYMATAITAGALIGFGNITPPVNFAGPLDALTFVMRLTLDPSGQWSAEFYANG
jgi:hypothetical protein